MAKPKFYAGQMVRLVRNDIQPQYGNGKSIFKVKKTFQSTNSDSEPQFFYRLEGEGITLKGIVPEADLELI